MKRILSLLVALPIIALGPERPFVDLDTLSNTEYNDSEFTPLLNSFQQSSFSYASNNQFSQENFAQYKNEVQHHMYREKAWYLFNYPQSYQVTDECSLQNFARRFIKEMYDIHIRDCKNADYCMINQQLQSWRYEVMRDRIPEFNKAQMIREQKAKAKQKRKLSKLKRRKQRTDKIIIIVYLNNNYHS